MFLEAGKKGFCKEFSLLISKLHQKEVSEGKLVQSIEKSKKEAF